MVLIILTEIKTSRYNSSDLPTPLNDKCSKIRTLAININNFYGASTSTLQQRKVHGNFLSILLSIYVSVDQITIILNLKEAHRPNLEPRHRKSANQTFHDSFRNLRTLLFSHPRSWSRMGRGRSPWRCSRRCDANSLETWVGKAAAAVASQFRISDKSF